MQNATYKVITRLDANDKPLIIVKFQVEYEVVLDQDRFNDLSKTIIQYSDGVKGDKLTPEEFRLWQDELNRIQGLWNNIGELPPYQLNEIETQPSSIPRGLLHQILTTYEENTKSKINTFITGQYPNFIFNLNWGTLSYSFPINSETAKLTQQAFTEMSAKTQQCINEKKQWDETKKLALETGMAVVGTSKVTADIIKCCLIIAGISEMPILALALETACTDIFSDLKDLIEEIDKQKAAKELAEREAYTEQVRESIERTLRCADVEAGIKKSRDIDKAMNIRDTA